MSSHRLLLTKYKQPYEPVVRGGDKREKRDQGHDPVINRRSKEIKEETEDDESEEEESEEEEKEFKCSKCPKQYTRVENLRYHERNEHGDKPDSYPCKYKCGKSYRHASSLWTHEKKRCKLKPEKIRCKVDGCKLNL